MYMYFVALTSMSLAKVWQHFLNWMQSDILHFIHCIVDVYYMII